MSVLAQCIVMHRLSMYVYVYMRMCVCMEKKKVKVYMHFFMLHATVFNVPYVTIVTVKMLCCFACALATLYLQSC